MIEISLDSNRNLAINRNFEKFILKKKTEKKATFFLKNHFNTRKYYTPIQK